MVFGLKFGFRLAITRVGHSFFWFSKHGTWTQAAGFENVALGTLQQGSFTICGECSYFGAFHFIVFRGFGKCFDLDKVVSTTSKMVFSSFTDLLQYVRFCCYLVFASRTAVNEQGLVQVSGNADVDGSRGKAVRKPQP